MSYFQNTLFMATLIRRQGVEGFFQSSDMISLLIYVQMETHLLIETAIKYMKKNRRGKLQRQDIQLAAQYIGHQDLTFPTLSKRLSSEDSLIPISKLAQSCGFNTSNRIESARLKGRFLFKEGKICQEFANRPIRQLKKEQLYLPKGSGTGQFNMIYFNEHQLLSAEEANYLNRFQQILLNNRYKLIKSIDGNVMKMFTLYLELIRHYPNEAGIRLLQELVGHPLVSLDTVCYHLIRILEVLLVYRGSWAYQVGKTIVKLIQIHLQQQPALLRLMEVVNSDYSFVLKAIAFQEYFQVDSLHCKLQPLLERALKESNKGNHMAILCLHMLLEKSPKLQAFHKQKVHIPLWIPTEWTLGDRYLSSA